MAVLLFPSIFFCMWSRGISNLWIKLCSLRTRATEGEEKKRKTKTFTSVEEWLKQGKQVHVSWARPLSAQTAVEDTSELSSFRGSQAVSEELAGQASYKRTFSVPRMDKTPRSALHIQSKHQLLSSGLHDHPPTPPYDPSQLTSAHVSNAVVSPTLDSNCSLIRKQLLEHKVLDFLGGNTQKYNSNHL